MKLIFLLLITYLGYYVLKNIAMKNRAGRSVPGGNRTAARPRSYNSSVRDEMPGAAEKRSTQRQSPQSDPGEEMVLDPVCSSYVPMSAAIKKGSGSSTVYFCSEECKSKHKV